MPMAYPKILPTTIYNAGVTRDGGFERTATITNKLRNLSPSMLLLSSPRFCVEQHQTAPRKQCRLRSVWYPCLSNVHSRANEPFQTASRPAVALDAASLRSNAFPSSLNYSTTRLLRRLNHIYCKEKVSPLKAWVLRIEPWPGMI